MDNSSLKTLGQIRAENASIALLNTSRKQLRDMKEKDPRSFSKLKESLLVSQLDSKRIAGLTKLALNRLNSI